MLLHVILSGVEWRTNILIDSSKIWRTCKSWCKVLSRRTVTACSVISAARSPAVSKRLAKSPFSSLYMLLWRFDCSYNFSSEVVASWLGKKVTTVFWSTIQSHIWSTIMIFPSVNGFGFRDLVDRFESSTSSSRSMTLRVRFHSIWSSSLATVDRRFG